MDTLRGFAAAVCGPDRRAYAVPDPTDVSYERHTLVVAAEGERPRIDLYEGYWAPDVTGTRLAHVLRQRSPSLRWCGWVWTRSTC
jgi:hypothetical protein